MKTQYNSSFTSGKYYVYRHIRVDTGMPFYIGIGTRQRGHSLKSIYSRAYATTRRGDYWYKITKKTDYQVEIIYECDTVTEVKNKEVEFIAIYGRKDNGGILCNMTDGGDGLNMSTSAVLKRKATIKKSGREDEYKDKLIQRLKTITPLANEAKKVKVYVYDLLGTFIREMSSVKECASFFGYSRCMVRESITAKRSSKKYIFSYSYVGEKLDTTLFNIIAHRPANGAAKTIVLDTKNGSENVFDTRKLAAHFMGMSNGRHMSRAIKRGKYKHYKVY